MSKYRILTGKALSAYLKHHPRLARAAARARIRMLRIRIRIRHPQRKSVSRRALALASHFVGTKEYPAGSNLTIFGRWYGENGVPWCAIFVSYVLSHVGRPFKYAYVPAIVADARANKNGLSVIAPSAVNAALAAGRPVLACYDWNHDGVADHVGFVTSYSGGQVHAIEGNTGDANWSNGGEVMRESRAVQLVEALVRVS
jgi:hypothetical protein